MPSSKSTYDRTLQRLILDSDALSDLMAPLDLGWKARAQAGEISGLSAYVLGTE